MRPKAEIENGRKRGALAFRVTFGYGKDTLQYFIIWILFEYILSGKKGTFHPFQNIEGGMPPRSKWHPTHFKSPYYEGWCRGGGKVRGWGVEWGVGGGLVARRTLRKSNQ